MTSDTSHVLAIFSIGVVLMLIVGFYCVVTTRNLIRTLIGLEILSKSVSLLIIIAGDRVGQMALAQSLVITFIVIEVVVLAVATAIILSIYRHHRSIDRSVLTHLKG
jgi:multisubunit Na+/H+ antiporter MnhC subunit